MIRLEEYGPGLLAQVYTTVQAVTTISIKDLEDIGIYRIGHQRLLLAIKKVKEVSQKSDMKKKEETNCLYQRQEIMLPVLEPGNARHDKFSSFHQPSSGQDQDHPPAQQHNLQLYCSPYTTYGQQDDLPPPLPELIYPSHTSTPLDDLPPPIPEPMQPLHYSLYMPTTDISLQMKPSPGMFRSHDENLILRKLSRGGILHQQDNKKPKPVAMVTANARISQGFSLDPKPCEEGRYSYRGIRAGNEVEHQPECRNISLPHSWKSSDRQKPQVHRRNSINCLQDTDSREEVLNIRARNSMNTNNSEETKLLMSKSGPSSPNPTLSRRKRMSNSGLSIPDGNKNSGFLDHTSAEDPNCQTPERSRSR